MPLGKRPTNKYSNCFSKTAQEVYDSLRLSSVVSSISSEGESLAEGDKSGKIVIFIIYESRGSQTNKCDVPRVFNKYKCYIREIILIFLLSHVCRIFQIFTVMFATSKDFRHGLIKLNCLCLV